VPGTVATVHRYPVKSLQGESLAEAVVVASGLVGDRRYGLLDRASGRLLSAKLTPALLHARASTGPDGSVHVELPERGSLAVDDPALGPALDDWMGRPVALREVGPDDAVTYEMTLDPPNDDAEVFTIPAPSGTFVDLSPIHLLSTATLAGCAARRPDLDWDVRRFRPNLVVDLDAEPFTEDGWSGRRLRVGGAVLAVVQPTVRCAMPLRAQPGLQRQRGLYAAMEELHANHLGVYVDVVEPGTIAVGDPVQVR
jgi:uncharacterized protein YcbX